MPRFCEPRLSMYVPVGLNNNIASRRFSMIVAEQATEALPTDHQASLASNRHVWLNQLIAKTLMIPLDMIMCQREYCLSNYILICFPIMLVVTRAIGREAWTPVRNARIRTWSRPGRPRANSAGSVGAVAISLRVPRCVGDHCGKNR